ncbi:hypothetical protein SD10_00110 [Spirosoma radiotolerans]|uniref:Uncharacterized protein n=1 Tax=Spirosoma radiotolerans TaxID=1379870 RepID=A0A0E3ZR26_9BACT|nr:hypothetical protein SD10_00110 [Spirosoma radiotolerans]
MVNKFMPVSIMDSGTLLMLMGVVLSLNLGCRLLDLLNINALPRLIRARLQEVTLVIKVETRKILTKPVL